MRVEKFLPVVACLLLLTAAFARAGTAFTYQGRLVDAGVPANGSYDFEFRLFDAATNGNQVGSVVTVSAVAVANGLFTVALDFGANFDGASRWLQISPRPAGGGAFTTLAPRQQLTPAPSAIYASKAGDALLLGGVAASSFQPAFTVLPVSAGGTGASNASAARAALGSASLGANTFTGNQQVTGNVTATGAVSGASGSFSGSVTVAGVTIGGDASLPTAPRMYFPAFLSGPLTGTPWTAARVVPSQPIVVTRVIAQAKTAALVCAQPAVIRLGSATAGQDLLIGTAQSGADSGPMSLPFAAGTPVAASLRSAASCTVNPADAFVTVEYRMGAGSSACGPSNSACSGFCTNVQTDAANCGTCGNACAPGVSCTAGTCAPLPAGTVCALGSQCQSGSCVDGVCCDAACNGTCQACTAAKKGGGADGVCAPITAGIDPDNECAAQSASTCGTTGVCSGTSACQLHSAATVCAAPSCSGSSTSNLADVCSGTGVCQDGGVTNCLPLTCNGATGLCRSSCTVGSDCATGYACQSGVCKLANGQTCSASLSCASGFCVDGVCCNGACSGTCEKCTLPGSVGSCSPIPSGQNPDGECAFQSSATCGTTGVCSGARSCQLYSAATVCAAPVCTGPATSRAANMCSGAGVCTSSPTTNCGSFLCNATTGLCRTSCTTNSQCNAGFTCNLGSGVCQ